MELWKLGLEEMAGRLSRGELSSAELVDAHQRRIEARDAAPAGAPLNGANPPAGAPLNASGPVIGGVNPPAGAIASLNAFAHRFTERAREEAAAADRARAQGDRRPLLGLPLTVKESIETAGLASTLGVSARRGAIAGRDAVIVQVAREQGAVFLGKTNVSQLLLFHESDNPLFGRTLNPWDPARVPGGSSGGEAAAIAAGLSPGGIGTDIGGSVRVPAAFTGIAGLKPTNDRWSNVGAVGALAGQEIIRGQTGPLARTARDVAFLFGCLSAQRQAELDPAVPPLPLREASVAGLTVGVYESDGWLEPAASVKRAVREAADHLRAAGVRVVPYAPPEVSHIVDTYFGALSSDGGVTVDRVLAGERAVAQLQGLRRLAGLPALARASLAMLMGLRGEQRTKQLIDAVREKPVAELWRLAAERTRLRNLSAAAMQAAGVDALLCPAHVTPAIRHGDSADFALGGLPSMLYNFLNFPAGVVPVSRVRAGEGERAEQRDRLDRRAAAVVRGSEGLPLAVQIVARPWQEERVLALMIAIEDGARGGPDFPRTPVES